MLTAKIVFIIVVGGGLLCLLNWPLFQFVDNLLYGSSEAAAEDVRQRNAEERQIRAQENTNVFYQAESLLTTGNVYRSDYQRSWTLGEMLKAGIVIVELLIIGSWFLHK